MDNVGRVLQLANYQLFISNFDKALFDFSSQHQLPRSI